MIFIGNPDNILHRSALILRIGIIYLIDMIVRHEFFESFGIADKLILTFEFLTALGIKEA